MGIKFEIVSLIYGVFFISSVLMLSGIVWLSKSKKSRLKSMFVVPSHKSQSGALLLGGLPFSILLTSSLFLVEVENPSFRLYLNLSAVPFGFLILYGYLDDLYEILPKYKLFAQCVIGLAGTILYFQGKNVHPYITTFPAIYMLYILVMNGTNLIDGIDTLSTKIGAGIFLQYAAMAFLSGFEFTFFMALLWFVSLIPFSYFNKAPAKLYLGEIGSSMIGLSSVTLFSLCAIQGAPIELACIPLIYPVAEVVMSFVRRILSGKGPFVGDKLHIHQLLHREYKFSPAKASWVLVSTDCLISAISVGLYLRDFSWLSPFVGFSLHILRQLAIGQRFWFASDITFKENLIFMAKRLKKGAVKENYSEKKKEARVA